MISEFYRWARAKKWPVDGQDPDSLQRALAKYYEDEKIKDIEKKLAPEGDDTDDEELKEAQERVLDDLKEVIADRKTRKTVNKWLNREKVKAARREQDCSLFKHSVSKTYLGYSTKGKTLEPQTPEVDALFADRSYDIDSGMCLATPTHKPDQDAAAQEEADAADAGGGQMKLGLVDKNDEEVAESRRKAERERFTKLLRDSKPVKR